ncbi:hypothetical protein PHYSODRAFT_527945 [Phytophthora sojae]|uniref:Uncharacterized protein n=1 Tax=Phytophthora sojae (strain P6497) TaxID=1094619 RepID=G5AAW5_PHYSP|nr:hypothetical protein PHYSODRAFT_527945 [Phytophthora sojae]EGZ07744.1 hypothetical protein PHYSODRAFT_527945 [Phytophthora sojae]|eukprot:XP_009537310.1 hypothetical protein PHYSODRAFT_527945 [Phytophthora sojae]
MAFNLMAHSDVDVFYITLTEDVTNLLVAFFGRSNGFVECVKRDLPEVGDAEVPDILAQPQLYVYGLIWAMLRGATIFRGPRTRQDVMRAMASREENGKTSVFFLDDFPSVDPLNRTSSIRKLRYMLNVFRSFGLAVVVTGASGVIHDLVRVAIRSKECDGLWCVVFPSIPKFHDPYVESIPGDLGRIILSSRPLFAELAVEYTKMTPYQSGQIWHST